MITASLIKGATVFGGLAWALLAGAGVASAEPDLGPAINTTCNYSQVTSALNAENPAAAAQFNQTPAAQSFLRSFLAAPPAQRQQLARQALAVPGAQQYMGLVGQLANTCNNY